MHKRDQNEQTNITISWKTDQSHILYIVYIYIYTLNINTIYILNIEAIGVQFCVRNYLKLKSSSYLTINMHE